MLKFLLCILGTVSIAAAFTVDVKRTYFFNDLHEKKNPYIQTDGLPKGIDKTSNDIYIKWMYFLGVRNANHIKAKVTFDYKGKYPNETATFDVSKEYETKTIENFGKSFFNEIMAKDTRYNSRAIKRGTNTCHGHLKWNRNYAKGVHCDVPVIVTLEIRSSPSYEVTTKAIYEGQFKTDGDYCPKE